MKRDPVPGYRFTFAVLAFASAVSTLAAAGCSSDEDKPRAVDPTLAAMGKDIFRMDTFGDETFWTDTLKMNEVIQSAVSPMTALSVGLKVDAEAIPAEVVAAIQGGMVDLTSPATTVTLLKL